MGRFGTAALYLRPLVRVDLAPHRMGAGQLVAAVLRQECLGPGGAGDPAAGAARDVELAVLPDDPALAQRDLRHALARVMPSKMLTSSFGGGSSG